MSLLKRLGFITAIAFAFGGGYTYFAFIGALGQLETPGVISGEPRPAARILAEDDAQAAAANALGNEDESQILFGDLHVHTTYSLDAFLTSLPVMQGEGAHPPADACDFARYCSALDFYSINDHAEGLTSEKWDDIRESVRQCNAVGDPDAPDLIAYLGWEWTQMAASANAHYGHKNVVLLDTADEKTPTRPIAAAGGAYDAMRSGRVRGPMVGLAMQNFGERQRYFDMNALSASLSEEPRCPDGVAVRDLPAECSEVATTPRDLFEKLDDWGFPSIVIPHGNAWGNTTPAEINWEKQLANGQHDPKRQTLIEIYSGHGSSEVVRPWRHVSRAADGSLSCPAPSDGFVPECHRAGDVIFARCQNAGSDDAECEGRAVLARQHFVEAGRAGTFTIPGQRAEDWLEAGQCPDCFQPAYLYRPGGSTQQALAVSGAGVAGAPDDPKWRFRFGLIGSSDNHQARPASGYKEFRALGMTDALHAEGTKALNALAPVDREPRPESVAINPADIPLVPGGDERLGSFFYTGGLVAVHATRRDRQSIWDALQRKQVYGTSGPRILLWFDLLNPPSGRTQPMGSEVVMSDAPRFRVRAVGSRVQKPGCPEDAIRGLGEERLAALCFGECYHPGDTRRRIERIEVIRIHPRNHKSEDVGALVDDPWRVFECEPDEMGCAFEFEDSEFGAAGRDAVYYVRVLEEPSELVNGDPLRCERDSDGQCLSTRVCRSGGLADNADECLDENRARAWSSPIFVDVDVVSSRADASTITKESEAISHKSSRTSISSPFASNKIIVPSVPSGIGPL